MHVAERRRKRAVEPAEPAPGGSAPSRPAAPPRPVVGNRVTADLAREGVTDAYPVSPATATRIGQARGGGAPLPAGARSDLEGATGRDLGGVRLHAGPEADRLAKGVGANAFTSGSDVFFRSGML